MKKIMILIILAASAGLLLSRIGREETGGDRDSTSKITEQEETAQKEAADTPADTDRKYQRTLSSTKKTTTSTPETVETPESSGLPDKIFFFILPERNRKDSPGDIYKEAKDLLEADDPVESRRLLTEVYLAGDRDLRKKAAETMDEINAKLVFDPSYRRGATVHTVRSGETLGGHIGPKYGVNWRMLLRINNISRPELIRVNQKLKILEGRPRIIVDKTRFTLTLFIEDYYVREYPVGLGRDGRTPTGTFSIDSLLIKADWYPPRGGVIKYGEEGHLIGSRWIGFENRPDAAGYGIHGTSDPDSIGAMESEGCIRLRNEDVEELYDFLVKGTKVKIFD